MYQLNSWSRADRLRIAVAGRTVVITGASSGIGREVALQVGRADGRVLLLARRRAELEAVQTEIRAMGGEAFVYQVDLADLNAADQVTERILHEHGGVDVLVNNAGRSIRRSVSRSYLRFHDYTRTMQLNYFAAVKLVHAFLPGMRARGLGHIINVSSIGLQTNMSRFTAYNPSKAALDAFARSLAAEVAHDRVYVTTVYMPLVRTAMSDPTDAFRRLPALTCERAARLICTAIITHAPRVSTRLGLLGELAGCLSPRLLLAVMRAEHRLLPESQASVLATVVGAQEASCSSAEAVR